MGQRLREVAEMLALGAELFRVKPNMVGIAQHLLKAQSSFVELASARQCFHIPEGAQGKSPLVSPQAISAFSFYFIAVNERVAYEVLFDRPYRRQPARVDRTYELHQRH